MITLESVLPMMIYAKPSQLPSSISFNYKSHGGNVWLPCWLWFLITLTHRYNPFTQSITFVYCSGTISSMTQGTRERGNCRDSVCWPWIQTETLQENGLYLYFSTEVEHVGPTIPLLNCWRDELAERIIKNLAFSDFNEQCLASLIRS